MRVHAVHLDEDVNPTAAVVELSLAELVFLAKVTGRMPGTDAQQVSPKGEYACSGIYSAITGAVIHPYFEDGVDEAVGAVQD